MRGQVAGAWTEPDHGKSAPTRALHRLARLVAALGRDRFGDEHIGRGGGRDGRGGAFGFRPGFCLGFAGAVLGHGGGCHRVLPCGFRLLDQQAAGFAARAGVARGGLGYGRGSGCRANHLGWVWDLDLGQLRGRMAG